MRLLVVFVALLGCRGEPAPRKQQAGETTRAQGSASADPWAVDTAAKPGDPPSLAERHKLADQACPAVTGAYFYRVEKTGKTSYLLGTRHISVSLAKMPKPVHDAIASARLAVFETAPDDKSDLPHEKLVLRDALGPELFAHYEELVGRDIAQRLTTATPAEAAIMMIATYEDISALLEKDIENELREAEVPMQGLETSEFQDRVIHKLLDLRLLKTGIKYTKDREELRENSQRSLREYCAGTAKRAGMDEDDRNDMLAAGYTAAEIDAFDETMVYARNADWIPKLEKLFETDHVFIAVGAAHLRGPRGVVALLEKRGYKLTRITQ